MNSLEFDGIADVLWKCGKCQTINNLSFLYQGYNINVTNSFETLAGIPADDSVFSMSVKSPMSAFAPAAYSSPASHPSSVKSHSQVTSGATSSSCSRMSSSANTSRCISPPGNFKILVVNCNGVRRKLAELAQLLRYTDADAVTMCET